MRKWIESLFQGVLASLIMAFIPAAWLVYLQKIGSSWAIPLTYGLAAFVLLSVAIAAIKSTYRKRLPKDTGNLVRSWLDKAGTATKNVDHADFFYIYNITLNEKKLSVAQPRAHSEYIDLYTHVDYTEDHNHTLEQVQGGLIGIVRLMRICLALKDISCSGVTMPLKRVVLTKRLLITEGLNEEKFWAALFSVEAALNLVLSITDF